MTLCCFASPQRQRNNIAAQRHTEDGEADMYRRPARLSHHRQVRPVDEYVNDEVRPPPQRGPRQYYDDRQPEPRQYYDERQPPPRQYYDDRPPPFDNGDDLRPRLTPPRQVRPVEEYVYEETGQGPPSPRRRPPPRPYYDDRPPPFDSGGDLYYR
ncbi:uncharacterized protein [Littorina saxatilis]|uniref:Uncharacterized protein n=1 Tax=Littorina saxatilis TaxID=31220 RepID=A0AAN9AQN2_9CAEN